MTISLEHVKSKDREWQICSYTFLLNENWWKNNIQSLVISSHRDCSGSHLCLLFYQKGWKHVLFGNFSFLYDAVRESIWQTFNYNTFSILKVPSSIHNQRDWETSLVIKKNFLSNFYCIKEHIKIIFLQCVRNDTTNPVSNVIHPPELSLGTAICTLYDYSICIFIYLMYTGVLSVWVYVYCMCTVPEETRGGG